MKKAVSILLLLAPLFLYAQSTDFGTEWEAAATFKPWKGAELTLGEELRFKNSSTLYSKSESSVVLQQSLFRKPLKQYDLRWKVGGGYSFINRQNKEFRFYNSHRFVLQTSLSKDWGRWRLASRLRLQSTFRNPSTGEYRVNPQNYLRFRLSARYNLSGTPWQFSLSEEAFCRLADPKGNFVDESRTQISATYDFSKHHSLTLYGKWSQELQVANPERFFALGLSYQFQ